jgi:hypothetical protein
MAVRAESLLVTSSLEKEQSAPPYPSEVQTQLAVHWVLDALQLSISFPDGSANTHNPCPLQSIASSFVGHVSSGDSQALS